jgi:hypothetical protein
LELFFEWYGEFERAKKERALRRRVSLWALKKRWAGKREARKLAVPVKAQKNVPKLGRKDLALMERIMGRVA